MNGERNFGNLDRLMQALVEFHKLDPEMTVNRLLIYLNAAINPGHKQTELEGLTGLQQSGASRAVATLSKFQGFNQPGLDLVESMSNPQDRRHKVVGLTPKGERLATKLDKIISG